MAGEARVEVHTGYDCYNGKSNYRSTPWVRLNDLPFTFSHTRNNFVVIGCDTYAFVTGERGVSYSEGCMSICANSESFRDVPNGSCAGLGCCQITIPRGLKCFSTSPGSFDNYMYTQGFKRCGYFFLAEEGAHKFSQSDLKSNRIQSKLPLVLDWSIANLTCAEAKKNRATAPYACIGDNSECVDSNNGIGYLCNCSDGYEGNPYVNGSCVGASRSLTYSLLTYSMLTFGH